jgi:hypothetical protein
MKIKQLLAILPLLIQSFTFAKVNESRHQSVKEMLLAQPEQKVSDIKQNQQPVLGPNVLKQATRDAHNNDEKVQSSHNTYQAVPITPETIKKMAPKMSAELKRAVKAWVAVNHQFLKELVTPPDPFTHETRKDKTKTITALIAAHNGVKSLSDFNYVLKPVDTDLFLIKINRWGSRMAYLVYATDQGNVLDKDFDVTKVDCSKLVGVPTYQHISNVAHYLRLKELMEQKDFKYLKTSPFYLVHVPGQPKEICDENYITVQEFVPTFVDLRALQKNDLARYTSVLKNLPSGLLEEMYQSIKYAALWDFHIELGVTDSNEYYILDLEEPIFHKPQFFYFQGNEGYQRYLMDVRDGLQRVADDLKKVDEAQFERWKKVCASDVEFIDELKNKKMLPEYLKA